MTIPPGRGSVFDFTGHLLGRVTYQSFAGAWQEDGGPILVTLIENDLVDEYRLMVFPVVLGSQPRRLR
jgi:dihydrofolate reductase